MIIKTYHRPKSKVYLPAPVKEEDDSVIIIRGGNIGNYEEYMATKYSITPEEYIAREEAVKAAYKICGQRGLFPGKMAYPVDPVNYEQWGPCNIISILTSYALTAPADKWDGVPRIITCRSQANNKVMYVTPEFLTNVNIHTQ